MAYADLFSMSNPSGQTAAAGQSLFDFNQRNYVDPNDPLKLQWNFYQPDDMGGWDNNGVNPVRYGPTQYNLGDQFYRDLGYTGQAWDMPSTDQQVNGGASEAQQVMRPEFAQWLKDKGYMYGEGMGGSQPFRGYFDRSGKPVKIQGGASDNSALEHFIRDSLLLYAGGQAFGAAAGAGGGAGGAAAGEAAGYASAADAAGGLLPEYGTTAAYDAALGSVPAAAGTSGFVGPDAGVGAGAGAVAPAVGNALGSSGTTFGVPNNLLGTGIAAGTNLLGGVLQNNANKDAIEAQAKAAAESNALLRYMYDTQRQDQAPWMEAGKTALGKLTNLLNSGELTSKFAGKFDPSAVQMDPGYQFGLDQGQKAIQNSAAARGMGLSGAALKDAARFGNDYATTKYDDAYKRQYGRYQDDFNRFYAEKANTLNPLFQMSGLGQTATNQVQQAGTNYANQTSNNITGLGNARAAAGVNRGNIYGNMLANLGGLAYDYFNP